MVTARFWGVVFTEETRKQRRSITLGTTLTGEEIRSSVLSALNCRKMSFAIERDSNIKLTVLLNFEPLMEAYTRYKIGPRIEPWGTPQERVADEEAVPCIRRSLGL